jgi:hypothetical protein
MFYLYKTLSLVFSASPSWIVTTLWLMLIACIAVSVAVASVKR